jgi:hypothetical protein
MRLELGRPEGALEQLPDLRIVVDDDHAAGGRHHVSRVSLDSGASSQTAERGVNAPPGLTRYHGPVFIVAFEGTPPPDKAEWIEILREVLAGELGSYRVVFRRTPRGFRFEFEWRDDGRIGDSELVANSPDSVGYNIYVNLAGAGKEIDPGWRPEKPREDPRAASSSPAGPPSRPAAETRTTRGR